MHGPFVVRFGRWNEVKRVSAVFFRTEDGAEPVRAWLKSMAKEDRFKIGLDIKTVEVAWPVGMPHCRPLGNGLHEVRTNLTNRTARVLFFVATPAWCWCMAS